MATVFRRLKIRLLKPGLLGTITVIDTRKEETKWLR